MCWWSWFGRMRRVRWVGFSWECIVCIIVLMGRVRWVGFSWECIVSLAFLVWDDKSSVLGDCLVREYTCLTIVQHIHVSCVGNSLACCLSSGAHGVLPPYQLSTCSGLVRKLRRLRGEIPRWVVNIRLTTYFVWIRKHMLNSHYYGFSVNSFFAEIMYPIVLIFCEIIKPHNYHYFE